MNIQEDDNLFYWIAKEKIRFQIQTAYRSMNINSVYDLLFKHICDFIDKEYNNVISETLKKNEHKINSELELWRKYWENANEVDYLKRKALKQAEILRKEAANKGIADKATHNIFNAVRRKDINAIIFLRLEGADLTHKNGEGLTVLEYAMNLRNDDVINILKEDIDNIKKTSKGNPICPTNCSVINLFISIPGDFFAECEDN